MTDELVLYTNPMSRGRIARWMLEEVGQPYRAEIVEYAADEVARISGDQSDGQGSRAPARRYDRHRIGSDLRLSRRRLSRKPASRRRRARGCAGPTTAGCSSPPVRSRRPSPTRRSASSFRPERARMVGYGSLERTLAALEDQLERSRIYRGRPLHRGGRICRIAYRIRHDVRHDRQAACVRALLGADQRPSGRSDARARSTTSSWPSSEKPG